MLATGGGAGVGGPPLAVAVDRALERERRAVGGGEAGREVAHLVGEAGAGLGEPLACEVQRSVR